jgi:hypothetical protein
MRSRSNPGLRRGHCHAPRLDVRQGRTPLAQLTRVAANASNELTSCFGQADLLPPAIGRELADAVETIDYLRFLLHELALQHAVHGDRWRGSRRPLLRPDNLVRRKTLSC